MCIRDSSKTNEPKKVPFNFKKLDTETQQPLKGVTFVLYGCDEKHAHNNLQDDKIKSCWQTIVGTRISGTDAVSYTHLDVYKRQVLMIITFVPEITLALPQMMNIPIK